MQSTEESLFMDELKRKLPCKLLPLLNQRDGAARLLEKLPDTFPPEIIATTPNEQRAWELTGLYYFQKKRFHEALPIFAALYYHMLAAKNKNSEHIHKGMPLVWMSDCYLNMGFPVHAKRNLMLTLSEDAIRERGEVSPDTTGIYFRLVWGHGLPDSVLKRYAKQIYDLYVHNPSDGLFPEWILQELNQDWITEFPSPEEALVYSANIRYIQYLISKLGESTGKILERLADYVLSCMPGCRTTRRKRSKSTDYDIVCSMEGFEVDFRSELGRYFVCECKDWKSRANFTTMAKFCRVLDSTKSHFGILFSKNGLSGQGKTTAAEREQLKIFQDRGMVIVVVDLKDLEYLAKGSNFTNLLREKYERVRLDLIHSEKSRNTIS